jgi:phage shock protein E
MSFRDSPCHDRIRTERAGRKEHDMKRSSLQGLACALCLLMLASCSAPSSGPATVRKITPQDARSRLDSDKSIVLVDVRTKEEYDQAHIAGAILVPVDTLSSEAARLLPDRNATYFVYCRSGNRSATASKRLVELGYRQVYDLGGIVDWPYGTVGG